MTQPDTISVPATHHEVFHPDAMAALAELTGTGDEDPPAWQEHALCAQTDPDHIDRTN